MLANAFIGASKPPTQNELSRALGSAKPTWDELVKRLASECGADIQEWGSSSKKMGWSLRVKKHDRVIVYLAPSQQAFMASFALGDKAVAAAKISKLPASVLKTIKDAKRYAEGTAVRLEIHDSEDVETVVALAAIKIAH